MFAAGAARNQGIEALATLPDGALLAVGEGATGDDGRHLAALRSRSGTVRVGEFASDGGLDPTDAVAIGPWLLILERRLSLLTGWHSRIVAVPIDGIGDGTPLVPDRAGARHRVGIKARRELRGPGRDPGRCRRTSGWWS